MSEDERLSYDSSFNNLMREYTKIIKRKDFNLYSKTVGEALKKLYKPELTESAEITKQLDESNTLLQLISIIYEIVSFIYGIYTEKKEVEQLEIKLNEESSVIESPDLTDVISEDKNLQDLIETNRMLFNENKRLTDKIVKLTEKYEVLVEESNQKISDLDDRIKQLVASKVSVSRIPKYWVQDILDEIESDENVEV